MSIVLQIGQCGNQLGEAIFDILYSELYEKQSKFSEKYKSHFFYTNKGQSKPIANAISIDMEPKVIENLLQKNKSKNYIFSPYNSYTKQEGSGNNWAFGYYSHGPKCENDIIKKVNHLAHKFHKLKSIIILQSMAGGTGSGLGSYLLTVLKDEFPNVTFINFMVAPKKGGEVILQNYNALFSLATVYEYSDYVFLLQNDRASDICKKILDMKKIDMDALNSVLSKNIVSSLLVDDCGKDDSMFFGDVYQKYLARFKMGKLIGNRFLPHVKIKNKDFITDNWFSITKRAFQMQVCGSTEANVNWNLNPKYSSNVVKTMGTYIEFNSEKSKMDEKIMEKNDFFFKNTKIYHHKINDPAYKIVHHERNLFDLTLSTTLLTNSQEYLPLLDTTFEKAKEMYSVNAYVFQYENFGLDVETMVDLFHYYKNIIEYYKDF